jgi:hypothetical protein
MLPEKYSWSDIKQALRDPWLAVDKTNRVANKALYRRRYSDGFDVMAADWDNLLIIDGCRYDVFERLNDIEGELQPIISLGSHSTEFLDKTFVGNTFHDTIYITANPHAPRYINGEFFKMETLYEEGRAGPAREHYPENVVEMSRRVFENHPDKRYIVHFMQPNVPFLGPTAEEVRERLLTEHDVVFAGMTEIEDGREPRQELGTLKAACEEGYITRETLWQAYEENVEIALEYVKKLLDELDGKTAVTADHGEMLGERLPPMFFRQFGHSPEVYTEELRTVPWFVPEFDSRRETRSDPPIEREQLDDDVVKERLSQLGYADYA